MILGEKQDFPSPLADRQISIILIFPGNGNKAGNGRLLCAKMKQVIDLPSLSFRFLDGLSINWDYTGDVSNKS